MNWVGGKASNCGHGQKPHHNVLPEPRNFLVQVSGGLRQKMSDRSVQCDYSEKGLRHAPRKGNVGCQTERLSLPQSPCVS